MLDSKFKTKQQLLLHDKRRDDGTVFEMARGLSFLKTKEGEDKRIWNMRRASATVKFLLTAQI